MKRVIWVLLAAFLVLLPAGCKPAGNQEPESYQAINMNEEKNHFMDTAILVAVDTSENTITFQNIETGLRYTLTYDGTTYFTDRSGNPLAEAQLVTGSIADISFFKRTKKLEKLSLSTEYFCYNRVDSFTITNKETRLDYLTDRYVLDDYLVIADHNQSLEVSELQEGDVITLYGKDHVIYSISLESGHGYVKLANDNYFIGGFIEVGKIIKHISENMILTVPEGKYNIIVSNDGISGTKEVTVGRNQEVVVDLGDIDTEKKYGNILFVLSPENAVVFVDGVKVDSSAPVKMEYGIHQLIVMAEGYTTLSEYINVGSPSASINVTLTKANGTSEKNSEKTSDSENSSEKNSSEKASSSDSEKKSEEDSNNHGDNPSWGSELTCEMKSEDESSSNNSESNSEGKSESSSQSASTVPKVYIDAPVGAEIYVDGTYIGIAPASFTKTKGTVVVTVRKDGYKTRSYTIELDDEKKDVRYSFSELVPS